jgi:hypothetical protein
MRAMSATRIGSRSTLADGRASLESARGVGTSGGVAQEGPGAVKPANRTRPERTKMGKGEAAWAQANRNDRAQAATSRLERQRGPSPGANYYPCMPFCQDHGLAVLRCCARFVGNYIITCAASLIRRLGGQGEPRGEVAAAPFRTTPKGRRHRISKPSSQRILPLDAITEVSEHVAPRWMGPTMHSGGRRGWKATAAHRTASIPLSAAQRSFDRGPGGVALTHTATSTAGRRGARRQPRE